MWDQTYRCAKQYRCSIAYYLMYFYQNHIIFFLDRAVDTPGTGKDVVDGFNAVQKRYLDAFLIMSSIPEVDKIDSKRMSVDAMTERV